MSGKLAGKAAIMTGPSKGIGASIARHLGADRVSVVVNYASSQEGADRVVDQISKKCGRAIAVQADLSKMADIERIFATTKETFGRTTSLSTMPAVRSTAPLKRQ